jgi:glucose-1-phosphate thymidylyltransferase
MAEFVFVDTWAWLALSNRKDVHPALVGRDCLIKSSYIGPYSSIGNNCEILNSEVEDSVVMDAAKLINAGNVFDSMIGRGAVIEKNNSLPKGSKFIIGDNSWVKI